MHRFQVLVNLKPDRRRNHCSGLMASRPEKPMRIAPTIGPNRHDVRAIMMGLDRPPVSKA